MLKMSVFKQIFKLVIKNILADKVRTLMTCLGIIIGTATLICMMTSFKLADIETTKDDRANGYYYSQITYYRDYFKNSDLENLRNIDNVIGLSPEMSADETINVKFDNNIVKNINVVGIASDYYNQGGMLEFIYGSGFTKEDEINCERVCIINRNVSKRLFGKTNPVGLTIYMYGLPFKILGVSKKTNDSSKNRTVYIPYTSFQKIHGSGIDNIWVIPAGREFSNQVDLDVCDYMNSIIFFEEDYYDSYDENWLAEYDEKVKMESFVQSLVAILAMLIGGIGIMNMMLVMVTERTIEIGLRKALGATPKRIELQFILESMIISLLGSIAGIVVGLIGSVILCIKAGEPITINPLSILLSLAFAVSVGVFFGWSPAKKASRLNPIDALKSE